MKTLITTLLMSFMALSAAAQTVTEIQEDIQTLTGKNKPEYQKVAKSVQKYSTLYKVEYKVVLALLMTESTFRQHAVSHTGDLGIGQINPRVWAAEFLRLKKKPLDVERLKTDADYAIARTVEILSILKCNKDPNWFGKYHSKTPSLKRNYAAKLQSHMDKLIESSTVLVASN